MTRTTTQDAAKLTHTEAIRANLRAMRDLLTQAAERADEAAGYMEPGYGAAHMDTAIGTVLGLDATLEDATALYKATLALHRAARRATETE